MNHFKERYHEKKTDLNYGCDVSVDDYIQMRKGKQIKINDG